MRILGSEEPNWFFWKLDIGLHPAEGLGSQKLGWWDEVCHGISLKVQWLRVHQWAERERAWWGSFWRLDLGLLSIITQTVSFMVMRLCGYKSRVHWFKFSNTDVQTHAEKLIQANCLCKPATGCFFCSRARLQEETNAGDSGAPVVSPAWRWWKEFFFWNFSVFMRVSSEHSENCLEDVSLRCSVEVQISLFFFSYQGIWSSLNKVVFFFLSNALTDTFFF